MLPTLSRRGLLRQGAAVASGFAALKTFAETATGAQEAPGYGPLVPDPDNRLDLPAGFSYRIISSFAETMDDGFRVPAAHDGMAAFPGPAGRTVLVRNHELDVLIPGIGAFGPGNRLLDAATRAKLYDRGRNILPPLGGTTTLVFNTRTQRLESHFLSLAGTMRNCAGGPTPWRTWLSCEESTQTAELLFEQNHGYVFEVPAAAESGLTAATPIRPMGRFNHEAVSVDSRSGIVYLTEDRSDSLIYRYIPFVKGRLALGGRLQALAVRDQPSLDTRNWETPTVAVGERLAVRWIDLADIDSPDDDLRLRGFDAGAARFARGEGMWFGWGAVYFACTNGGEIRKGQIWRYFPSPFEGSSLEGVAPGRLELFIEPNDVALLENADNLAVAPWGDLIVCEDGDGRDSLVGVTQQGALYPFARNPRSNSEFAGATFSPDGTTLFVNIQVPGRTFAITGPWLSRFAG